MSRARYIALEGTEGVGKTTVCDLLDQALRARGVDLVRVREPGGTPLGESVREILLHGGDMTGWTEALLFAAQRSELLSRVVRPALSGGRWVVSDRSFYSSLAYQGHARGLGVERTWAVNAPAVEEAPPDLVVWLETDHRTGLFRQEGPDRIGGEDGSLHRDVWKGYRRLWAGAKGEMLRVDASAPPGQTAGLLVSVFEERGWLSGS